MKCFKQKKITKTHLLKKRGVVMVANFSANFQGNQKALAFMTYSL